MFSVISLSLKRNLRGVHSNSKLFNHTSGYHEDIQAELFSNKGVIVLNRPKSFNALTLPMIKHIFKILTDWEKKVDSVVIRSSSEKAFCVGGDVYKATEGGPTNGQVGRDTFFFNQLNAYSINQYQIPFIALADGITMGSGVGLSMNGKYCIATEKSLFAMPETAVGLCPDVGTSYFFSRMEGKLGLYLALTGHRLRGKDGVKTGFASHYVESKYIPVLLNEILKSNNDIESTITKYCQDESNYTFSLTPHMDLINKAFSAPTVEEIIEQLQIDGSDFSKATLKQLNKMSPIALKAVKMQLEKAGRMPLWECCQMEYRLSRAAVEATSSMDFYEGTRALREKQIPKWSPAKLEDVSDEMVKKLFLPLPPGEELQLPRGC